MRRTQKVGREPVSTSMRKKGWELPSLDLLIGLAVFLLAVLILASFPLLGAATVVLFGFISLGQIYPKLVYAVAKTGEVAGGLVLALGLADKGIEGLIASARLVSCVRGWHVGCRFPVFISNDGGLGLTRRAPRDDDNIGSGGGGVRGGERGIRLAK